MPVDTSVEFHGYAVSDPKGNFEPFSYHPRSLESDDIEVAITHCGICASDLHTVFGGWGPQNYPIIPGHEIVGLVKAVGNNVTKFKVGDRVGVGCQCGCCLDVGKSCRGCSCGMENHCQEAIYTYPSVYPDGEKSHGGYSTGKRLNQRFAFRIPENISSAEAAPLLCAGVTTFAPLKRFGAGPGKKVGVIGVGGLGHLAVQFAAKMGAEIAAFGTSPAKKDLAIKLGASHYVNIKNEEEMNNWYGKLDIILCTADANGQQQWDQYVRLGNFNANFVVLSVAPVQLSPFTLIGTRVQASGSAFGSPNEIREMFEFCSLSGVRPLIEVLPMSEVNEGVRKVQANDVKFRIVLEN